LSAAGHVPVLATEAIDALQVRPDGCYLDGTVGRGGHAEAIAARLGRSGFLLGLDRDPAAAEAAAARLARFGERVRVVRSSYIAMRDQAARTGRGDASWDGVLLDLGIGSHQLDDPDRGFSFRHDGALDMRYHRGGGVTAADLVNDLEESELADLLFRLGEERASRRIARAVVRRRGQARFERTGDLAGVVASAAGGRKRRIHPATQTFQALRIAVNDELGQLERALPDSLRLLAVGGRLAVISFHSLEDRTVKRFMRNMANPCLCPPDLGICSCGRKPMLELERKRAVMPSAGEVERNPRSRSARLRVAVRTDESWA
jgi:16S rRNA (cytosine1402-N4)-methyltransferase